MGTGDNFKRFVCAGIIALGCTVAFGQPGKNTAQVIQTPFAEIELMRSIDESSAIIRQDAQPRQAEYGPADTIAVDNQTIFHEWGTFLSFEKRFDYADRCVTLFSAGGDTFASMRYFFLIVRKNKTPLFLADPEFRSDDGTLIIRQSGRDIRLDLGYFHSRGRYGYHRFAQLQDTRLKIVKEPHAMRPPAGYAQTVFFDVDAYACQNLPLLSMNDKHWDYYVAGTHGEGKLVLNINVRDYTRKRREIYTGKVLVKAPDQSISFLPFEIPNDGTYVDLEYPGKFKGPAKISPGVYTVLWEIEEGLVGCNGFQIKDNDSRIAIRHPN